MYTGRSTNRHTMILPTTILFTAILAMELASPASDTTYTPYRLAKYAARLKTKIWLGRAGEVDSFLDDEVPPTYVGPLLDCSVNWRCPVGIALQCGHYNLARSLIDRMIKLIDHQTVAGDLLKKMAVNAGDHPQHLIFECFQRADMECVKVIAEASQEDHVPIPVLCYFVGVPFHSFFDSWLKDSEFKRQLISEFPHWFEGETPTGSLGTQSSSRPPSPRSDSQDSIASATRKRGGSHRLISAISVRRVVKRFSASRSGSSSPKITPQSSGDLVVSLSPKVSGDVNIAGSGSASGRRPLEASKGKEKEKDSKDKDKEKEELKN